MLAEQPSILDELNTRFNRNGKLNLPQMHLRVDRVVAARNIFSYALQPKHELVSFEELHVVHRDDDAFTASLKYIVRTMCARGFLDARRCNQRGHGAVEQI